MAWGGFYDLGLPFGLEISAWQWTDGDLIGWAYAYVQATKYRHPTVLVGNGLLPNAKSGTLSATEERKIAVRFDEVTIRFPEVRA